MVGVAVVGCGMTKFGKSEKNIVELMVEAGYEAIRDAGLEDCQFDEVIVGNMASGEFEKTSGLANALVSELALEPAAAYRVENTSASGASAFQMGYRAVASGEARYALVVGVEKMTGIKTSEAAEIIASITHHSERRLGITLPSLAGLAARYYMSKYNAPYEALARVAVKNHYNASLNPKAHFQKRITVEEVMNSPLVSDPLRLYDFCPVSDGAAAVVLTSEDEARKLVDRPVKVAGIGAATDTQAIHEREELIELKALREAASKAYEKAKTTPAEIQVAELHDMSTILEIIESEVLGFYNKGEGWKAVMRGETELDGRLPINPSGGLKARGHPLGATAIAQIIEITRQLQGRCGERQVKAEKGLTCSLAGFAQGAVVAILEVMR